MLLCSCVWRVNGQTVDAVASTYAYSDLFLVGYLPGILHQGQRQDVRNKVKGRKKKTHNVRFFVTVL